MCIRDRQKGEPREKCLVFEGFMDYLSFLTLRMKNCPTMPNLDRQDSVSYTHLFELPLPVPGQYQTGVVLTSRVVHGVGYHTDKRCV